MSVVTPIEVDVSISQLQYTLDYFWVSFAGLVVLFMQLGFAFLEGGCVRFKNMQSIMIKVFLNAVIAIICWWICGYGIAFGALESNKGFIGIDQYTGSNMKNSFHLSNWVLQASVGAAANSIVSGGAAERMSIGGYCIVSVIFSAFIYPVCVHWAWGGGWLMTMGYHDLAGSGVIHLMAAVGALTITTILRPRKERFEKPELYAPSNTVYITLATLSLYMCWIFFNAGGVLELHGEAAFKVGRATSNTMIAGASGGLTVVAIYLFQQRKEKYRWSLTMICNGNLAGLVAVTGSADGIELWAAFIIGILGGCAYMATGALLHKLHIDDPVDAVPIHGGCGLLGAQMPGWFDTSKGILYGNGPEQWGYQLLGTVVWIGWSLVWHLAICAVLYVLKLMRVPDDVEEMGLDNAWCGGPAYDLAMLPSSETPNTILNQSLNNKSDHQSKVNIKTYVTDPNLANKMVSKDDALVGLVK